MIPTVAEERALALRRPSPWRRTSILTQVVLFVLTALAIAGFYWLCSLMELPAGVVTLLASIGLAEVLIWRNRFWRTGVESALWLGGLVAFIASLPSSGKPEAILAFVAAAAIAGWRMRDALFGALAFVLLTVYFEVKEWRWLALAFMVAVVIAALVAELRVWQRPSTELFWQALLVVMPLTRYEPFTSGIVSGWRVVAIYAALAAVLLAAGVHQRLRVVLLSAAITIAVAAIEVQRLIRVLPEWYLIGWGALALAVAGLLMRLLRGRERGFVLSEEPRELDELLQVAGTLPLATPTAAPAQATPTGGGQFGGAGASGQF